MASVKRGVLTLKYCVDGEWRASATNAFTPVTDSSTGDVFAQAPCAPPPRSRRPSSRPTAPSLLGPTSRPPCAPRCSSSGATLLEEHMEEVATPRQPTELGKNLDEARGEVIKIIEACRASPSAPRC